MLDTVSATMLSSSRFFNQRWFVVPFSTGDVDLVIYKFSILVVYCSCQMLSSCGAKVGVLIPVKTGTQSRSAGKRHQRAQGDVARVSEGQAPGSCGSVVGTKGLMPQATQGFFEW